MDLKQKICTACRGDEPTLSKLQIGKYLKQVSSNWKVKDSPDKIIREFEFEDFKKAIAFVNRVAEIAEKQGHHPNLYIHSYNKVKIELWTHKIGGLHENDFIMAAKIDNI